MGVYIFPHKHLLGGSIKSYQVTKVIEVRKHKSPSSTLRTVHHTHLNLPNYKSETSHYVFLLITIFLFPCYQHLRDDLGGSGVNGTDGVPGEKGKHLMH